MNKVLTPLAVYLNAKACCYELDQVKQVLHGGMDGVDGRWRFRAFQDNAGRFAMVSHLPLNATDSRHVACVELCARINGELGFGHFNFDFLDGELSYRTAVPLSKRSRLSTELIEDVLRAHQIIVDRFLPVISTVLFAGYSPEKAMALAGNLLASIDAQACRGLN